MWQALCLFFTSVTLAAATTVDALFKYQQPAVISCKVNGATGGYKWEKNGVAVSKLSAPDGKKFTDHSNGTLQFHSFTTTREDAGEYECVAQTAAGPVRQKVTLYAEPFALFFDTSKNLVQGGLLDVKCFVLGYPKPSVKWLKNDVEIKSDGSSFFKFGEYNGIPNAHITFDKVDFNDAGTLKCVASAEHVMFDPEKRTPTTATHTASIRLRVFDKLSVLWPLIGIVAQFVVLVTIICISEKKQRMDDAAAKLNLPPNKDLDLNCG